MRVGGGRGANVHRKKHKRIESISDYMYSPGSKPHTSVSCFLVETQEVTANTLGTDKKSGGRVCVTNETLRSREYSEKGRANT